MYGEVTVVSVDANATTAIATNVSGGQLCLYVSQLTRIPTHAERMQKMVDTAMDCENRLEPHETVQFTVAAFVEFARHYCLLREKCEAMSEAMKSQTIYINNGMVEIDRLLKGETP